MTVSHPAAGRLLRALPYALLIAAGGLAAYFQLFSQFAGYDDEGGLLIALSEFLHGRSLYDGVYTQYGPLYFEIFGALFKATGLSVTNDVSRQIVLVIWIGCGAAITLIARRATKNMAIAIASGAVGFSLLSALAPEPMHPISLVVTFVILAVGALLWTEETGWERCALVLGIAAAALVMVKINLGALVTLAIVSGVLISFGGDRRWARPLAIALLALAPLALTSSAIDDDWVQKLLFLHYAGLASILVIAWPAGARSSASLDTGRLVRLLAIGFGATVVLSSALIVALGSPVSALVDGVLIAPTRQPGVLTLPLFLPETVFMWSIAAVAAAACVRAVRALRPTPGFLLAGGLIRGAAAITIWLSLTDTSPITLAPPSGRLLFAILLAWTAAVAPRALTEPAWRRFARLTAALLCVLASLQTYPVAISQVLASALPFTLLGAIVAHDSVTLLKLWGATASERDARLLSRALPVAGTLLAVFFAVMCVGKPLNTAKSQYDANMPLALHGAGMIRVPAAQAQAYEQLTAAMSDCEPLVMLRGYNSFYFWAGKRPPSGQNATVWQLLLESDRQQKTVDAIRGAQKLCVLRNDAHSEAELHNSDFTKPPDRPLYRYLTQLPLKDRVAAGGYRLQVLDR